MTDEVSYPDARERHVTVARVALHRAADLLEAARLDESRLEIDEALELVFLALEELDSASKS